MARVLLGGGGRKEKKKNTTFFLDSTHSLVLGVKQTRDDIVDHYHQRALFICRITRFARGKEVEVGKKREGKKT